MKRIEKYREHRRPCEWHQKWRGDLIDQIPEQQQRPVRKDGRYLVTRRRVSFADRLRHRYIITLLSRHQVTDRIAANSACHRAPFRFHVTNTVFLLYLLWSTLSTLPPVRCLFPCCR